MELFISNHNQLVQLKRIALKIASWVAIGVTLLLIFTGTLLFSLQTRPVQALIQNKINDIIPGTLQWDYLRFSLLNGTVHLKDLKIRGPNGDRIAELPSLGITISLPALRQHTITVNKIYCKGISADIISDSLQRLNIVNAFAAPSPKKDKTTDSTASFDWNIIAKDLLIELHHVTFRDMTNGINTGLNKLSLSANGNWCNREATIACMIDTGWFSNSSMSLPLSDFSLKGALVQNHIDGCEISVQSENTLISIHGDLDSIFDAPRGSLATKIEANLNEIDKNFHLGEINSGIFFGELTVVGGLKNPNATLSIDFTGEKIAGYRVNSIHGTLSLNEMVCTVPTLMLSSGAGRIQLHTTADLSEAFPGGFFDSSSNLDALTGEVSINAKNIPFSIIDTSLQKGHFGCSISAKVKGIRPEVMDGSLALTASVKNLSTNNVPASLSGDIALNAGISRGRIAVKKAFIKTEAFTLDVSGNANILQQTMKCAMDINAPNLADVTVPLGIKGLKGAITSEVSAEGTFKNPQAHININASNLAFSDITIGNVTLLSHLGTDGTVHIKNITTHNGMSQLKVAGSVDLFPNGLFTPSPSPRLAVSMMSKGIFLHNYLDSIAGKVTLAADISGTLDNLTGRVRIKADSIVTSAQDITSASLSATILGDSITLENFTVKLDKNSIVTGKGFYTFTNRFGVHLDANNISLQSIKAIGKTGSLDGLLSLHVTGSGSVMEPLVSGSLALSDFTLGSKPLQPFSAMVSLEHDTVRLNGKGLADINAILGIKNGIFSADLAFDSTNLTPVLFLAGQAEMDGLIDGAITAMGNIYDRKNISAETDLALVHIGYRELTLVSGKNIRFTYDSGVFSIPDMYFSILDSGRISIDGSGSIDSMISFGVDASIPLGAVVPFITDLPDLTGIFLLHGTVSGTLKKPVYRISAEVADAMFTIPVLDQQLNSLNAKVVADTGELILEFLKGYIENGSFKLDGRAEHANFKPHMLQARLTCNNLPISLPETMEVLLDGNLNLHGDSTATAISGDIAVLDGLYYKPVNITELITPGEKRRTITSVPDTTGGGFMGKTVLDIAVLSRKPFTVDNNLATMEIKPDIQIKGTLKKPVINGRGEVTSGIIKWQKRDLVITKGVVDFLNPYQTEATLDIESEIDIKQWVIQLAITGTAPDGLTLSLSEKNAQPPLSDADIISILATGRTTAELLGGEGGKTKEQFLASLLASEVSKQLQDKTLLDKVDIEAGSEDDPSGTRDVKVTVGKELSRRLTTFYSFETGREGIVQRGSAEFKLLERLLLSGFQDTDGTYGGALEWNLQWR